MTTYQIRIDNGLYEGSPNFKEAEYLYKTVDDTCLKSYRGKTKSLVKVTDGNEEILQTDTIEQVAPCTQ